MAPIPDRTTFTEKYPLKFGDLMEDQVNLENASRSRKSGHYFPSPYDDNGDDEALRSLANPLSTPSAQSDRTSSGKILSVVSNLLHSPIRIGGK